MYAHDQRTPPSRTESDRILAWNGWWSDFDALAELVPTHFTLLRLRLQEAQARAIDMEAKGNFPPQGALSDIRHALDAQRVKVGA